MEISAVAVCRRVKTRLTNQMRKRLWPSLVNYGVNIVQPLLDGSATLQQKPPKNSDHLKMFSFWYLFFPTLLLSEGPHTGVIVHMGC